MTIDREFVQTDPLPDGRLLLQASAGTGKTYSITSVVLQLVAEHGIPVDRLLVVTFTRAAAAELRGRIRDRIARAVVALESWPDAPPAGDEVVAWLCGHDVGSSVVAERLDRLRDARRRLDGATIDTIHGFCARTLEQVGPLLGVEVGAELEEDLSPLIDEVVNDVLVRRLHDTDPDWHRALASAGVLDPASLASLVTRLEGSPDVEVLPASVGHADPRRGWLDAVERFAAVWNAERDALADWIEQTRRDGGFAPRQRTYTVDAHALRAAALDAWIARAPGPGDLDGVTDALDKVSRGSIESKLAPGVTVAASLTVVDEAPRLLRAPERMMGAFRADLLREAVVEVAHRKAAAGVLSFSDLLGAVERALADPRVRAGVRDTIRARFSVALIDEFQDTDPVQWRIFSTVFDDTRLVLVGDPKQAIYAFRGADVRTYLAAADSVEPDARRTLTTNYRSDARLLAALERLFARPDVFGEAGAFAEPGIDFVPVRAAEQNTADRLVPTEGPGPLLRIRHLARSTVDTDDDAASGALPKRLTTPALVRAVAHEIVTVLSAGMMIRRGGSETELQPGDLAVLVRTRAQAGLVHRALLDAGVPAVLADDRSVLDTPAAVAVERLLAAVLRPSDDRAVRAALVGPIFATSAAELDAFDDHGAERVLRVLDDARVRWRRQGVYRMLRGVLGDTGAQGRIAGLPRGERLLTDLLHLAELLHRAEREKGLGPERLVAWLAERRRARPGATDMSTDAQQQRLESDADAVQVVTVHRAKGLQYPVVWCPFLSEGMGARGGAQWFHDPDGGGRRVDVGVGTDPDRTRHIGLARMDSWREEIRLLYVALTRAMHLAIVHTGAFSEAGTSPLARVLYGADVEVDDRGRLVPSVNPGALDDSDLLARLEALADDDLGVEAPPLPDGAPRWRSPDVEPVALSARTLGRALDRQWQRTSFTSLVRGHEPGPAADGDGRDLDQYVDDTPAPLVSDGDPVPLATMPRGAEVGTFVHAVLEEIDFTQAGEGDHSRPVVQRLHRRSGLDAVDVDQVTDALGRIVTTPLGPLVDDRRLVDVGRADRLDELRFDLPVAGGYGPPATPLSLTRIAEVFEAHAAGTALAAAADRLRRHDAARVHGFMTGSIDLLARIDGRWLVVDYKSNWLGGTAPDGGRRSVTGDYHPDRLAHVMVDHDYLLQAHLYVVAVHRLLRFRLGGAYDYDHHVAGFAYLFLRGMLGVDTPRAAGGIPYGVFAEHPSRALVEDLDAVIAGADRPHR